MVLTKRRLRAKKGAYEGALYIGGSVSQRASTSTSKKHTHSTLASKKYFATYRSMVHWSKWSKSGKISGTRNPF